ncbi:TPA: hypothetical protein ACNHUC_002666 [Enterococcus faecium]|uniref:hypothetical protein n=1 Tax=Enterococcus TaxID=1350 RepID=UPI001E4EFEDA|nr:MULTISPECIES: hypothetical protein [Enterococcus]MCH3658310.1 hypothetical protein [Enterococcus faecium]MDW7939133.1 hypothetical protein [Enterococcus faecium]
MLVIAYIGFGNSVCQYHLPYVEARKEKMKVKYIYRREEDRKGDMERIQRFNLLLRLKK